MSSYREYMEQIEELKKKANEAREQEIASAKQEIAGIMRTYNLSLSDLSDSSSGKSRKYAAGPVAAKYRDPVSGSAWSGRGRAPRWLDGKNKEDFRIEG